MKLHRLIVLICAAAALAIGQGAAEAKRYQSVQIKAVEIEPDVNLPTDFRAALEFELREQLTQSKAFQAVRGVGQEAANDGTSLNLVTTVTRFNKGSQAKRYLVGFGAGQTKMFARARFVDAESGKVVYEKDVDGRVVMGLLGGDSRGAARGLAKEVAGVAKKQFR